MRQTLRRVYWWLEKRICPELRYSQVHYHKTLDRLIVDNPRWLELGCGHQMFVAGWMIDEERELGSRAARLVGVDLDFDGLRKNSVILDRIYGDIEQLPLPDQSFDLVTANMVVEHLQNPAAVLQEIRRVLRPGGLFVFHTPKSPGTSDQDHRLPAEGHQESPDQNAGRPIGGRCLQNVLPDEHRQ